MKKIILIFLGLAININAQQLKIENDTIQKTEKRKFNYKPLIIPTALISYGVIGLKSKGIKQLNYKIKDGLKVNEHGKFKIDDYAQYVPFASVYALNLVGGGRK